MSSSGNGTFSAPYTVITATDRSGQLLVVNAVTLTISFFSIAARIYISSRISRSVLTFYKDDLLCFAALLFSIIQFALVWTCVAHGNGKSIDLISPQHLVLVQKTQYAVDMFYLTTLFCSRMSIIFLLERLQGIGMKPLWMWSIGILSAWFITSVFAVALKCDLSHPWIQYNVQCTGLLARWQAIEILGIATECAMFGLALHLLIIGRIGLSMMVKIALLFTTRILVIVLSALRIAYLPEYFHSSNPTYDGIPTAIFALAEAHASIVTATAPLLKSFVLKFRYIGADGPQGPKPLIVRVHGRSSSDEAPGSRTGSNLTEHEKTTATSSLGGEGRPVSGNNPHSV